MTAPLMIQAGDDTFPHWASRDETEWPAHENFPSFLRLVWDHLGLPEPTERQLDIARRLQNAGSRAELIIRAYRGIGKSYICAAFVLWRLMRNPRDEKILVVSATGGKAKEFVSMVKSLLRSMDILAFLRPQGDQRDMATSFDVAGASLSQSYSVKAVGITGQITGSRATLIVADDIEIPGNSKTEEARARLMQYLAEFEAIRLPESDVIFLGTPQTEESIYNRLVVERGYDCYCVPARFPLPDKLAGYTLKRHDGTLVPILAPELTAAFEAGTLSHGSPVDPVRFDDAELTKRESKGRAYFALQYQLDTSLSDAERYPLRQKDLIVFEANALKAPRVLQWGRHSDSLNVVREIPNIGFSGDCLLRPLFIDSEWRDYEGGGVLFVDPAGRGKDETAWAIVKHLNGLLYCLHVGGHNGTPAEAMVKIAADAKRFQVSLVEVEPNYAQGTWVVAFAPILTKVWPGGCTVQESEWARGRKEQRIIDTLEPALTTHKLVISESLLAADVAQEDRAYSLLYQLTHVTREGGCLQHDDRLDALAGAVASLQRTLGIDADDAAESQRRDEMDRAIEHYWDVLEGGGLTAFRGYGRGDDGGYDEVLRAADGELRVYPGDRW